MALENQPRFTSSPGFQEAGEGKTRVRNRLGRRRRNARYPESPVLGCCGLQRSRWAGTSDSTGSERTEASRKSELQLGTTRDTEPRVLPRRRARRTFRFAVSIAVQRDVTRAIGAVGQLWAPAGFTFGEGDDA